MPLISFEEEILGNRILDDHVTPDMAARWKVKRYFADREKGVFPQRIIDRFHGIIGRERSRKDTAEKMLCTAFLDMGVDLHNENPEMAKGVIDPSLDETFRYAAFYEYINENVLSSHEDIRNRILAQFNGKLPPVLKTGMDAYEQISRLFLEYTYEDLDENSRKKRDVDGVIGDLMRVEGRGIISIFSGNPDEPGMGVYSMFLKGTPPDGEAEKIRRSLIAPVMNAEKFGGIAFVCEDLGDTVRTRGHRFDPDGVHEATDEQIKYGIAFLLCECASKFEPDDIEMFRRVLYDGLQEEASENAV